MKGVLSDNLSSVRPISCYPVHCENICVSLDNLSIFSYVSLHDRK